MNIISSITSSIASSIIAASSTIAAWFKLLTTNPANSSPTQGTTTFIRASAANYFDSAGVLRSAAVNTPRYQDGGLLIEQGSTNLCRHSQNFAAWAQQGMATAPTADTTVAPDGTLTADTLTFDPTPNSQMYQGGVITAAGTYTLSVWAKVATGTKQFRLIAWSTADGGNASLDFTATTTWQRVTFTITVTVATYIYITNNSAATAGTLEVWGYQVESGSKATSYIKTLGAAVTRAADICYTATANIPNLTRGAEFVWKGAIPDDGGYHSAFRCSPTHTIIYRIPSGVLSLWLGGVYLGSVSGIDAAVHTYTLRTNGSNLHELLIDGVVVHTSTATGLLQPTTSMYIGSTDGWSEFLNSSTQSFAMYSKAFVAWFKLLTTDPAASSPTQGATSFSRASSGTAVDANGLLVSYAADVPRQQDGGLLIEQGSTNFLSQSEAFNLGPWFSQSMTTPVTSNTAIAPDGTLTADMLTFDVASSSAIIQYAPTTTSGSKTFSVWVKVASGTKAFRLFSWGSADGGGQTSTLVATTTWQRFEYTRTTTTPMHFYVMNDTAGGAGTLEVWGAQLETGSKATSYIKTLAAPVTRAADMCHTAATNIPTLANGATFMWKGALPNDGVFHNAIRSTPTHTLIRRMPNGTIEAYVGAVFVGAVPNVDTAVHTYTLRTNGSNLHELLIDGVVVLTKTATGLLQPTTRMYIGSTTGTTHFLNDSTQSFTMYDTALTDAEIQGLG